MALQRRARGKGPPAKGTLHGDACLEYARVFCFSESHSLVWFICLSKWVSFVLKKECVASSHIALLNPHGYIVPTSMVALSHTIPCVEDHTHCTSELLTAVVKLLNLVTWFHTLQAKEREQVKEAKEISATASSNWNIISQWLYHLNRHALLYCVHKYYNASFLT